MKKCNFQFEALERKLFEDYKTLEEQFSDERINIQG